MRSIRSSNSQSTNAVLGLVTILSRLRETTLGSDGTSGPLENGKSPNAKWRTMNDGRMLQPEWVPPLSTI